MQDGIYNHRVYLPDNLKPTGQMLPQYTSHAREQAKKDRYGEIELPSVIDFSLMRIDEVEVKDGKAVKIVCRKQIDKWRDMTLVLSIAKRKVITVWSNMYHDQHASVDLDKYVRP